MEFMANELHFKRPPANVMFHADDIQKKSGN